MKAHEVLNDKTKWTQGELARDAYGFPVDPSSPAAVCWCMEGALRKANANKLFLMHDVATKLHAIVPQLRPAERPCDWNDDPKRTFDEVRQFLIAADL